MQHPSPTPWYIQDSPNFTALYEGVYNVAKDITCLYAYTIFYPMELNTAGLKQHATFWGTATSWSGVKEALIYSTDEWAWTENIGTEEEPEYYLHGKYWSGLPDDVDSKWYARYIYAKTYLNNKPYSLKNLYEAIKILMGDNEYTAQVLIDDLSCEVVISTNKESVDILQGLVSYDPSFLGKPVGIKLVYSFQEPVQAEVIDDRSSR